MDNNFRDVKLRVGFIERYQVGSQDDSVRQSARIDHLHDQAVLVAVDTAGAANQRPIVAVERHSKLRRHPGEGAAVRRTVIDAGIGRSVVQLFGRIARRVGRETGAPGGKGALLDVSEAHLAAEGQAARKASESP
jgi:hypothetical protein